MSSLIGYDTPTECQQQGGVWLTDPAPLCYLPVNNLPAEQIQFTQQPTSNADGYILIQSLCMQSMRLCSWLYIVLWTCGIFTRFIRARL